MNRLEKAHLIVSAMGTVYMAEVKADRKRMSLEHRKALTESEFVDAVVNFMKARFPTGGEVTFSAATGTNRPVLTISLTYKDSTDNG